MSEWLVAGQNGHIRPRHPAQEHRVELTRRARLAETMKYSLIVVSSAPVLLVYPFLQKHLMKGVMLRAIKG